MKKEFNMWTRKKFIQASTAAGAITLLGGFPYEALAASNKDDIILTILHTNDVHSRIEPFPMDGGKNQGLGGVAARSKLIKEIRATHPNVLLLDAGDIWQGTPYFNFFNGSVEYQLMNEMGYDAATLGNHDFDIGLEGLQKQLPNAKFAILNANYNFDNSILKNQIESYKIFEKCGLKIGVFGIGIELNGLVPEKNYLGVQYNNPIDIANNISKKLKEEFKCDFIICLSHLGFKYEDGKVSDEVLAQNTSNIDLILGGHTHTFFEKPLEYTNKEQKNVVVNQVGWAGIVLGKLDFHFDKMKEKKYLKFSKQVIAK
ncbi:MAG: metallophosphatase [Bacteroidota bacterium]